MENKIGRFYLDNEKDIVVDLFKDAKGVFYIIRTPNHKTGNLITNLSKVCGLHLYFDDNNMKIIKEYIPAYITSRNSRVYVIRFKDCKIANVYDSGLIEQKATIPAISKTLMAQTKNSKLDIKQAVVKTYILEHEKFHTDLHSHMNGNLSPDLLISLGIYHQIRYPLYYIKKLNLVLTKQQQKSIDIQREQVSKNFENSELKGKYLVRKIDDNTFINFADLILNNPKHQFENINKIRCSLTILKDSQAVFTNLEKLYLYRYVFTKGIPYKNSIELNDVDKIQDEDIKNYVKAITLDHQKAKYKTNTLFEDKLLWICREYAKQGIKLAEISDTSLVKDDGSAITTLQQIHHILPKAEKETGTSLRFLAGIRRMPLTLVKDNITPYNYLRDNLNVLKTTAKDPYVVGCDILGEEINDIEELQPVIYELVGIANNVENFTIRIHAGENDSLTDNVANSIKIIKQSLRKNQKFPKVRIGHGLYTADLNSAKGKKLIKDLKENNVVLEFQLTSNVRLNNLTDLNQHPLKEYLKYGIKCVQGTDGAGLYGTTPIEEQLSLFNLLKLKDEDLMMLVNTENEIISDQEKSFITKSKKFNEFIKDTSFKKALEKDITNNITLSEKLIFKSKSNLLSINVLKNKIKALPLDKTPIVIAGGSFNSNNRKTKVSQQGKELINNLFKLDPNKYYFVIGNKIEGYEKYIVSKNKKFEVYSIIPSQIEKEEYEKLSKEKVYYCVSIESLGMGLYKSFNYEIFERVPSILLALDGNSACQNLIQEAKNGKAKAKIYVLDSATPLVEKADSLEGYVKIIPYETDITLDL